MSDRSSLLNQQITKFAANSPKHSRIFRNLLKYLLPAVLTIFHTMPEFGMLSSED